MRRSQRPLGESEASRRWARRTNGELQAEAEEGGWSRLWPLAAQPPTRLQCSLSCRLEDLGSAPLGPKPLRFGPGSSAHPYEIRAELALAFEEALGTSRFISGGLFRGDEDERQETIKTPTKLVLQSSVSRRASHATAPGVLWPRGTPLTSAPFDTHKCKTQARGKPLAGLQVYLRRAFCVNDDELQRRSGQQEPNLQQITFIFQKYVTGTSVKIITRFE